MILPRLIVLAFALLAALVLPARAGEPPPFHRLEGEIGGARWAALVPENWDGLLLLEAPDRRSAPAGLVAELDAAEPDHATLLARGWAVATTSYRRTGAILIDAIDDLRALREHLAAELGPAKTTIVAGTGMGGLIATLMAERHADEFNGFLAIDPRFDVRDPRALRLRCDRQPRAPLLFLFDPATTAGVVEYHEHAAAIANAESFVPALWFRPVAADDDAPPDLPTAIAALLAWTRTHIPPPPRLDDLPAANAEPADTPAPPNAEAGAAPSHDVPLPEEPPPTVSIEDTPGAP